MVKSGVETLKASSYRKLAFEESSHAIHTLPSSKGLRVALESSLFQLVLSPGAAFHPSRLLGDGLAMHLPPRLELFVQVRDGIEAVQAHRRRLIGS